ncbi:SDR family oxidoreductase [Flavilitoribacter nigricans]|uniref:Epimerase n=1 Tax=Flavilitoribacter nigricans (strain ATCC 23147 / DSM 23189 / NBRC 102662 / NCIMB 1420 / SS-2) TaxID=1122177 RepID=A0A2D0NFI6_FLAN2|nr:SDR family oxidoreductase [Flavilitoribacter nigricans]PHN07150.1 epimerase [Flavilitoribacter nigricans DSM 23189 = NBRC 102662]
MRILLTGANGYIGKRLLPVLVEAGHEVIACVRTPSSFEWKKGWKDQVTLFQVDFLEEIDLDTAPLDFDIAYYLIHSMSSSVDDFAALEEKAARNFLQLTDASQARQIIYLTGMVNDDHLSRHLASRHQVEQLLNEGKVPLTALRAGIVIGSGSASFEIIRDLVEKLPVMVAPRWINTRCQPIAIRDVIRFLVEVQLREDTYHENFDIGCTEILTYREMLLGYAEVRDLQRWIVSVPVMTPRLSSYWLYFVTSTTYSLAVNLVNSMKIDVICRDNRLAKMLGIETIGYREAVQLAFDKIEQNLVVSSWKDALVTTSRLGSLEQYIKVPKFGCFEDYKELSVPGDQSSEIWKNILSIGGDRGWYYGNWLWKVRGYMDKMVGGIGLRRGRTHPYRVYPGDALDFWRVLVADHEEKRLLLYAEMKLPGEAWLEFCVEEQADETVIRQKAIFRPHGIFGRLYWYAVLPFHYFIFNGMIRNIASYRSDSKAGLEWKEVEG